MERTSVIAISSNLVESCQANCGFLSWVSGSANTRYSLHTPTGSQVIPLGGVQVPDLLQGLGRAPCHIQFAIGIDYNLNVIPTTAWGKLDTTWLVPDTDCTIDTNTRTLVLLPKVVTIWTSVDSLGEAGSR